MEEFDEKIDEMIEETKKEVFPDDPREILKKDRIIVSRLKRENEELKLQVEKLLKNNQKLTELVKLMEEKIKTLTEDMKKSYMYSYEKGGWIEQGALDEGKIKVAPSMLDVDTINNQLSEILRMIRKHRMNV